MRYEKEGQYTLNLANLSKEEKHELVEIVNELGMIIRYGGKLDFEKIEERDDVIQWNFRCNERFIMSFGGLPKTMITMKDVREWRYQNCLKRQIKEMGYGS